MTQTEHTTVSPIMREVILATAGYVGITTKAAAGLLGIDREAARGYLVNASRLGWVRKNCQPNRFMASTYTMTRAGRDAICLPASLWQTEFSLSARQADHSVTCVEAAASLRQRYRVEVVSDVMVHRYEKQAGAAIASAEMEGEGRWKGLPRLHRGDLAAIRRDGSLVVFEAELTRKSQARLEEIVAAWCFSPHPVVYLIPRGCKVEADVRRAIRKAGERNSGAEEKVVIQCLEDLLNGGLMPVLDALMSEDGTRQGCKTSRPRAHNQSGRKRTVAPTIDSRAATRR